MHFVRYLSRKSQVDTTICRTITPTGIIPARPYSPRSNLNRCIRDFLPPHNGAVALFTLVNAQTFFPKDREREDRTICRTITPPHTMVPFMNAQTFFSKDREREDRIFQGLQGFLKCQGSPGTSFEGELIFSTWVEKGRYWAWPNYFRHFGTRNTSSLRIFTVRNGKVLH